jgi:hypothetical protein
MKPRRPKIYAFAAMLLAATTLLVPLQGSVLAAPPTHLPDLLLGPQGGARRRKAALRSPCRRSPHLPCRPLPSSLYRQPSPLPG